MFFRSDSRMLSFLFNVYEHLREDYDFVLVVVGDTGTGKSMLAIHLLEAWYKVVLGEGFDKSRIDQVNTSFVSWVEKFKDLQEFDMNIYDEGSTSLDSKESLSKLSRDLTKLFNVFRSKRFFSVIILPSFFNLNKYFRENRLRGLVHVYRRGSYRLFSKVGINYLNSYNERRVVKSMMVARPIHTSTFPDYNGVLRSLYDARKDESVDVVLDEVIGSVRLQKSRVSLFDLHGDDVLKLRKKSVKKFTYHVIGELLGISHMAVQRIVYNLKQKGLL